MPTQSVLVNSVALNGDNVDFTLETGEVLTVVNVEDAYKVRSTVEASDIVKFQLNPQNLQEISIREPLILIDGETENSRQTIVGNGRLALIRRLLGNNLTAKPEKQYTILPFPVQFCTEEEQNDPLHLLQIAHVSNAVNPVTEADTIVAISNFFDAFEADPRMTDAEAFTATANYFNITEAKVKDALEAAVKLFRYPEFFSLLNTSILTASNLVYLVKALDDISVNHPDVEINTGEISHILKNKAFAAATSSIQEDSSAKMGKPSITKSVIKETLEEVFADLANEQDEGEEDSTGNKLDKAEKTAKKTENAQRKEIQAFNKGLTLPEIATKLAETRSALIDRLSNLIPFVNPEVQDVLAQQLATFDERLGKAPSDFPDLKSLRDCLNSAMVLNLRLNAIETQVGDMLQTSLAQLDTLAEKRAEKVAKDAEKKAQARANKVAAETALAGIAG